MGEFREVRRKDRRGEKEEKGWRNNRRGGYWFGLVEGVWGGDKRLDKQD